MNAENTDRAPVDPNPHGFVDGSEHLARAVRWLWDTDKNGTPCLNVAVRITAGDFEGLGLKGRLYFDTDRPANDGRTAADRSMEALDAMGCNGDLSTITDDGGGNLEAGDVVAVVGIDANGYPRVKFFNAPGRGGAQLKAQATPPEDVKKSFFAQMKARAQSQGRGAKATGTAPVQGQRPANGAQQPRPQSNARPAPVASRGPGAPNRNAPVDEFPVDANDDIPF